MRVPLPAAMMTTFNAMRTSFFIRCRQALIIGLTTTLAATLLAGCSAVRLAYDQGPTVVRWWLDGYFDLTDAQQPLIRPAISSWFDWHRRTQLPDYAQWLDRTQRELSEPVTAEQVCRWAEELRGRYELAIDQALPLVVEATRSLQPAQIDHLEAKYAKKNAEYRKEFLQPKPQERFEASLERAIDRAQTLYGRLEPSQKRLLSAQLRAAPFDAQAWYAQRTAQQQDILKTLRQVTTNATERPDRERTLVLMRGLKERWVSWRRGDAPVYEQRVMQANCNLVAELHNSTSQTQRQHAQEKLKAWGDDLRALASSGGKR